MIIRTADTHELEHVRGLYTAWGYTGGVGAGDTVFVAERDGNIIGLVRRTLECDTVMLRGMQVAPAERGKGVGTELLRAFVDRLSGHECYCVPYSHLVDFYGRFGFRLVNPEEAPQFLTERIDGYRRKGLEVELMCRPKRENG